ncbi:chitin binding Peritrophin-A domain protein, partial [Oesophagostomum dentatum]
MNCPAGTFFDETRGVCDFKEKIVACGGSLDEPAPAAPTPVVTRTTTPAPAHDDGCAAALQPLGRCSPKFVVCSNGILSEFNCSKPLVFNPLTITCDFREFVPECEQFQGADEPQTTTTEQTTTTTEMTTTTAPPSCVYNENRPAFALDYCARIYGLCSSYGILKRDECAVGFLFDSHLHTCVPAEQCGQKRLEELFNKVTFAPPVAAAQVDTTGSKQESRKDDRCQNSPEGAVKSLGRCRSTYLKCVGGEAVIQPCPTSAEVFSAA